MILEVSGTIVISYLSLILDSIIYLLWYPKCFLLVIWIMRIVCSMIVVIGIREVGCCKSPLLCVFIAIGHG